VKLIVIGIQVTVTVPLGPFLFFATISSADSREAGGALRL
jgi:hypothetical protein